MNEQQLKNLQDQLAELEWDRKDVVAAKTEAFVIVESLEIGLKKEQERRNSGVIPFHSICGDAPELKDNTSSDDGGEGEKINHDAALAIGKGAAMKELLNLPLSELERRCRHNGLSLVGGREMMVVRLLYLEEAEKQRVSEVDDDVKYGKNQSSSARYPSSKKEASDPVGLLGWNNYEDDMKLMGKGDVPSLQTNPIPRELNSYYNEGKKDSILPASKWAREDNESDDEQNRSTRDLGLTYSSSGSENAADGLGTNEEPDFATEANYSSHHDAGLNEELRQKFRHVEVALIEYRESLEERDIKSPEEIERKVEIRRRQLLSEYRLLDLNEDASGKKMSSLGRKDKGDDWHESSRKRRRSRSQSDSPQRKSSSKDRDRDSDMGRDRERRREREKANDIESKRGRDREKSGSRERDDHDSGKGRERDRERKR